MATFRPLVCLPEGTVQMYFGNLTEFSNDIRNASRNHGRCLVLQRRNTQDAAFPGSWIDRCFRVSRAKETRIEDMESEVVAG